MLVLCGRSNVPGKLVRVVLLVLVLVCSQNGCGTKETGPPVDYNTPIASKEFVVGPGRNAHSDNPPCIRRGMEDVLGLAKKFDSQSGTQSFGFLGKDITAPPVTLGDPRTSGGASIVQQDVADALRNLKGGDANILAADGYSSCATVAFLLTKPGQIRVVLTAGNKQEPRQPCPEGPFDYTKCNIGEAGWSWFHEDMYFIATFRNWSETVERTAKIDIYLKKK
jgi:hypothetical protein